MQHWVKLIGASDLPLPNDPFVRDPSLYEWVRFPRDQFPREINKGDELVYYAVGGYKKLFAIARLTAEPQRDVPARHATIFKRWPHAARVEIGPHLQYVEFGPDLGAVDPRLMDEIHQGVSHFRITPEQYANAVRLILRARGAEKARRPTHVSRA
jgi:hypothetical protein